MNGFSIISKQELRQINGGDWLKDFGGSCHRAWCSIKNGLEYLNEVGNGGRMHSAG